MIAIPTPVLQAMIEAAQAAFPREACGLLVGRPQGVDGWLLTRFVASANMAASNDREFEIDAGLRLRLQRELREDGPEALVGHFHSHPNGKPLPSAADVARAWEPDLIWLIAGIEPDEAGGTRCVGLTAQRPSPQGFRSLRWKEVPAPAPAAAAEPPTPGATPLESA